MGNFFTLNLLLSSVLDVFPTANPCGAETREAICEEGELFLLQHVRESQKRTERRASVTSSSGLAAEWNPRKRN